MKWAETKEELGVQLVPSGHSCCITASHTTPSPRPSQTGQCQRAWGSSVSGSAHAIPHQGNEQASLGASLPPTGVHHASAPATGDALTCGADLHLLSGTRTSQGNGMVGLLSLMSITTTVSVAEPTRGGVPLSIAVTTKLWESTRARHKVHRCGHVCEGQYMHAQHLEHGARGHCTCVQGWSVYTW